MVTMEPLADAGGFLLLWTNLVRSNKRRKDEIVFYRNA